MLISRGDWSVRRPLARASAVGQIDGYLPKPARSPDEQFHRLVVEFLDEWGRDHGPPFVAVRVVGEQWTPRCAELRDLLGRNGVPYEFSSIDSAEGCRLLEQAGLDSSRLPVVALFNGEVLVDPSNERIARAFAVTTAPDGPVDVAVVGAGPAGLAAAVYAASEGLSTVVLDREAIGGQAGTSSRIRNYLGFPRGVNGAELALRAFEQAWLFGVTPYLMRPPPAWAGARTATRSRSPTAPTWSPAASSWPPGSRTGASASRVWRRWWAPVCSTGRPCRRPRPWSAGTSSSPGAGTPPDRPPSTWPSTPPRSPCWCGPTHWPSACPATSSARSMPRRKSTCATAPRSSPATVGGRLERLTIEDGPAGTVDEVPAAALFVLIGGEPHTDWLPTAVRRDDWGFVVTGSDLLHDGCLPEEWPLERPPMLLETSLPGVFAVGDVRHRSVKRVASAVGDGSVAIQFVHQFLHERDVEVAAAR